MQGVYRIRNKLDGKRYIGSTDNLQTGWKYRKRALRKGKHHNIHLQRAWNKYGEKSFVFEVEESVEGDSKALKRREQDYLDEWFPTGLLYNIARKADRPSFEGKKHTEESLDKMRNVQLGENNGMFGKTHTQETKDQMRESHLGYKHTQEALDKMSISQTKRYEAGEVGTFTGKYHTEETKQAQSESKIGEKNPNYGKKVWNSGTAGLYSEEYCQKISEGAARPYPAFYNVKTEESIPAGDNLWGMCEERELNYCNMWNVKTIPDRVTKTGWRLAKEEEIKRLSL